MNNSIVNQYIKDVSLELCCDTKIKKRFLRELRARVEDFSETITENSINYELLIMEFGTPQEISDAFILHNEPSSIRCLLGNTKKRKNTIIVFGSILAMLIAILLIYQIYINQLLLSGQAIKTIYENQADYVPDSSKTYQKY